MSDTRDNGGPAFPVIADAGERLENSPGMTLRDYFAAKAMQAAIAYYGHTGAKKSDKEVATVAYEMADAMLVARNWSAS